MINKCPQCGFEPVAEKMICPNCGFEIKENIAQKIEEQNEQKDTHKNDNIAWSDFKDVSIGSVMETFNEQHSLKDDEEPKKESAEPEELSENPILSAYIRQHKGEEGESVEELIAKGTQVQPEADSATDEQEDEKAEQTVSEETEQPTDPEDMDDMTDVTAETIEAESLSAEGTDLFSETEEPAEPIVPSEIEETENETTQSTEPLETEEPIQEIPAEEPKEQTTDPAPVQEASEQHRKPRRSRTPYVAAAAVLVLGVGGWLFYDHQEKVAAAKAEAQRVSSALETIQGQLDQFYTDKDNQFIKENKSMAELETINADLAPYKKEKDYAALHKTYEDIKGKMQIVDEINQLFDRPIIVGDQLDKKAVNLSSEAVKLEKPEGQTPFDTLIAQAIDQASNQASANQQADEAVAKVYQKDQVAKDATRKNYEAAKEKVAKLPDSSKKEALTAALKQVDSSLTKKETAEKQAAAKKAAEAKAAEAKKQAAAAQAKEAEKQAALPSEASPNMQTNSNNQPILGTVPSDVADADNPAWQWAPGVKEKVLATCIARGYIVEGGYTLEKVRIENGEGYYNLFATNTRSKLMKGISDDALPFYLVTINCKTGYFRGNGSDHTVR